MDSAKVAGVAGPPLSIDSSRLHNSGPEKSPGKTRENPPHCLTDADWFAAHPERQARIREPVKVLHRDKQRAVRYLDESELQFRSLPPHPAARRRMIVWRIPADNPHFDPVRQPLITIPFVLLPNEEIPDTDEVLLPLIHELMTAEVAQ